MSKTLVVVLGQPRAHELTFRLFKKNVLEHLSADLCFCGDGSDGTSPYITEAKYCFTINQPDASLDLLEEAYQEIAKDYGKTPDIHWSQYIKIPKQIFIGGTKKEDSAKSSFLLYYRWFLLKHMRLNGLLEKYDRFIITRSDYLWVFKHPSMERMDPRELWVPDGECYGGITDRHAILSTHNIEEYLNVFNMMVIRSGIYVPEISNIHSQYGTNIEMLISYHLSKSGIRKLRVIPYNMFTVRAKDGTTSWSTGEYNESLGFCIKYKSEYAEAALFCYRLKKFNKTLRLDYHKFDPVDVGNLELENIIKGLEVADDTTEYYNMLLRNST
jgi:hypothetical protein